MPFRFIRRGASIETQDDSGWETVRSRRRDFRAGTAPAWLLCASRAGARSGRRARRPALSSILGCQRSGGRRGQGLPQPFPGTVSKISAQAGQTILVNDVLLVLEAMKMETVITAPIAGKVAKINVNVGDAVQQGQVLVEFD